MGDQAAPESPKERLIPNPSIDRPNCRKYFALFLSCLINLVDCKQCSGSLNTFGTFSVYYASFYYKYSPNSPLVDNCFFIIFPITCILEGLAFGKKNSGIVVQLYQALKLKLTLVIGGLLFSGAFFIPYFTTNATVFVVLYSIGVGLGSGFSGYICILECWKHFSRAKGTVMGVMAACYGLSPTVFGLLFAFLCNPGNEEPSIVMYSGETEYRLFTGGVADSVPWVSLTLGIIFACCYLAVILLFPKSPEEVSLPLTASIASLTSSLKREVIKECPDLKTAVKTWAFWSLSINMFCGITYGVFIVNVYKNYGMTFYQNDQLLSSIGSSAAFISAFGRVLFSVAMDVLSFKVVYGCNILVQFAISATITYIAPISISLYWIWIAISFFVFAGVFPSFIMESPSVFGHKCVSYRTGPEAMSLIGQSFTLSSIATIVLSEVIGRV